MKIAYILPSLENRGPIVFTKYLIDALKKNGVDCEIFYFNGCAENLKLKIETPCRQISFFRRYDFSDFDVVHTTMAKPDLYGRLRIDREKWVSSMHNYIRQDLKMLYRNKPLRYFFVKNLWTFALFGCKNIIVSSDAMLDYYKKIFKKADYALIPYGIEKKEYSSIDEKDSTVIKSFKNRKLFVLCSVGLFIYRKGFHQLIELLKNNKDVALVLIGDGDERQRLENMAKEANIEDRIFMPGFRNNSYNYYRFSDAYAHVSYSEGFGLAMLEALSHGLPLICSNLDIYNNYLSDSDVAFFKVDDSKSLQNALDKVRKNTGYYSIKSYKLFEKNFSSQAMASRHKKLYIEIGGGYERIADSYKIHFSASDVFPEAAA